MRTSQKYGTRIPADRVFVIGDTPHDIAAAREVGVRSIAVASGGSGVEQLRSAGPDAVFTDLTDPIALRSVIFGAVLPAR
jgi:phosphoglycolate phosphatase-like HAD superfamily hydrolase